MNADEAKKKAEAARAAQRNDLPKVDYMSLDEALNLIDKAASEGKTSINYYRAISEEVQDKLDEMGYWVLPNEIRFED